MNLDQEQLIKHFKAAVIDTGLRLRELHKVAPDENIWLNGYLLGYQSACETALELMGDSLE